MSAVGDVPEVMLRMLECSVCMLNYDTQDRQAMILQCGHYFCKICIEATARSCTLHCPKCRQMEVVSAMRKNFAINEMLETLCCQCVKRVQVHSCSHCPKSFCDGCHQHHVDELTEKGKKELQEKISIAKENLQENKLIQDEDIRKQKARDEVKSDVAKLRDALEKYEKDKLHRINCMNFANTVACKTWAKALDENVRKAGALLVAEPTKQTPETDSSGGRMQLIEDCSVKTKEIDEALKRIPVIQNYQYDSNNAVVDISKILDNVTISQPSDSTSLLENTIGQSGSKNLQNESKTPTEKPVTSFVSSDKLGITDGGTTNPTMTAQTNRVPERPQWKYRDARLDQVLGQYGTGRYQFNSPSDVAVAPNGNIYIADKKNHRVKIYDSDFKVKSTFGRKGNAAGEFMFPFSIFINSRNEVFISDDCCVQVYSATGSFRQTIGVGGPNKSRLLDPAGLTIGRDGFLYVCDKSCIKVYLQNGKYVRSFGHGVFDNRPMSIAMTSQYKLLISDDVSPNIRIFTKNGFPQRIWTPRNLPVPVGGISGIVVDDSGNILLSNGFRILTFDKECRFRSYIQSADQYCGQLLKGMALDRNGHIIACDLVNHNVLVFHV